MTITMAPYSVDRRLRSGSKEFEAWKAHHRIYGIGSMPIRPEAEKIWKILGPIHRGRPLPEIRMRFASEAIVFSNGVVHVRTFRSYAHTSRGFISLSGPTDWLTLAHELCHMACGGLAGHGPKFYEALRLVIEKRWKMTLSMYGAPSRYGYAWDRFFGKQIAQIVEQAWPAVPFVFEKQTTRKAPSSRKPRKEHSISAAFVEMWMAKNVGRWVTIAEVCEATGAAHMTARKAGKRWLRPLTARGLYRIEDPEGKIEARPVEIRIAS